MVSGGYGCSTAGTSGISYEGTIFDTSNSIDSNGNIKSWCVYLTGAATGSTLIKLKIFRLNGSNYDVVFSGEFESLTTSGQHTFGLNTSVPVLSGDLVGYFLQGNSTYYNTRADNTGNTVLLKFSDVMTTSSSASWSGTSSTNLRVNVSSNSVSVLYTKLSGNDERSGADWNNAKRNVKDALRFLPAAGTIHLGFEDYSSQPGIQFDKNTDLVCETVDSGGGTGTTTLPNTAWASFAYGTTVLDRYNTTGGGGKGDFLGNFYVNELGLNNYRAQRFIPSTSGLQKIILKLKRISGTVDFYIEVRTESGGAPNGRPQSGGELASAVVAYTSISTLALSEVTFTLDTDIGTTSPVWILATTNNYDSSSSDTTVFYEIDWAIIGTRTEYWGYEEGTNGFLVASSPSLVELYFKTYRGI